MTSLILRLSSLSDATAPTVARVGADVPLVIELTDHDGEAAPDGHPVNGEGGRLDGHPLGRHAATVEPASDAAAVVTLDGAHRPDPQVQAWAATAAASADSVVVLDHDGVVAAVSPAAAALLDCVPHAVGRPFTEAVTVVDLDTGAEVSALAPGVPSLDVIVQSGIRRSLMRVRRRDDDLRSIDCCAVAIHDEGGATVGSVTFLEPIGG